MANAMTPYQQFENFLVTKRSTFKKVLPPDVDTPYFLQMALNYVQQQPALMQCTPSSLATAMMRAARVGLVLDKQTGHAHILKFGSEAQYVPGYQGLIHLAKKYANAADVRARPVYENDFFDFKMGDTEEIVHRPFYLNGHKEPGDTIGYYAIIEYKDGFKRREFIPMRDIEHIKAGALRRTKNTGPWSLAYEAERMGVKTAIFRLFKQIDAAPQLKVAMAQAEAADAGLEEEEPAVDIGTVDVKPTKASKLAGSVKIEKQAGENDNGASGVVPGEGEDNGKSDSQSAAESSDSPAYETEEGVGPAPDEAPPESEASPSSSPTFGEVLDIALVDADVNDVAASKAAGVKVAELRDWKADKGKPSLQQLEGMIEKCGLNGPELLRALARLNE